MGLLSINGLACFWKFGFEEELEIEGIAQKRKGKSSPDPQIFVTFKTRLSFHKRQPRRWYKHFHDKRKAQRSFLPYQEATRKKALSQVSEREGTTSRHGCLGALARTPASATPRSIRPDRIKSDSDWPMVPSRQRGSPLSLKGGESQNQTPKDMPPNTREKSLGFGYRAAYWSLQCTGVLRPSYSGRRSVQESAGKSP